MFSQFELLSCTKAKLSAHDMQQQKPIFERIERPTQDHCCRRRALSDQDILDQERDALRDTTTDTDDLSTGAASGFSAVCWFAAVRSAPAQPCRRKHPPTLVAARKRVDPTH